jgi:hypothetical protein
MDKLLKKSGAAVFEGEADFQYDVSHVKMAKLDAQM